VQMLAHCLVLHVNCLQPSKLVHHTDRYVPLHYVIIANEWEHGRPKVLVTRVNGVDAHLLDLIGLVWLSSNLQIFDTC
jgi:hypothetical protein